MYIIDIRYIIYKYNCITRLLHPYKNQGIIQIIKKIYKMYNSKYVKLKNILIIKMIIFDEKRSR